MKRIPGDIRRKYNQQLRELKGNNRGFQVHRAFRYEPGGHPESHIDYECAFAARHLAQRRPQKILDVGSYRHFVVGLLAGYRVTTVDIRARSPAYNETMMTCDAKQLLGLASGSFEAVVSLCAIEHFGLGRYGDEFDVDADIKAFVEMVRVLKPGGTLIFSTTITRGEPSVMFNAHRIYDIEKIRSLWRELKVHEEMFFSRRMGRYCTFEEITYSSWDIYCGCWEKQ